MKVTNFMFNFYSNEKIITQARNHNIKKQGPTRRRPLNSLFFKFCDFVQFFIKKSHFSNNERFA